MANPYGITEIDLPGIYGAVSQLRGARMQQMLAQRQIDAAERAEERDNSIRAVLARAAGNTPPGQSGSPSTQAPAAGGQPQAPAAPAPSAPMAAPAAAPATQAQGLTPELAGQLIAIDPQQGAQIIQAFRQMDQSRMEQAERVNGLLARTGQYLLGIPEGARMAELQRITPQLIQQGIPQEQIANFQPSTANIQLAIAQARDIEKLIEDARPRLMNVDGQVIDQNRLTTPVRPGSPVMFESELIPTQNGVYRRSDLTGGNAPAPVLTDDDIRRMDQGGPPPAGAATFP